MEKRSIEPINVRLWLLLVTSFTLLILTIYVSPAEAQRSVPTLSVEVEGGPLWQSYNDIEVPNDGSATRFSFVDQAGHGPWAAGRLYITWNPGERHGLRLLLAPLSINESLEPDQDIDFDGASFEEGVSTDAVYTFNSYRLTYRYSVVHNEKTTLRIGLTGKIRDAWIDLQQEGASGRDTDLGFVPLLHLAADWYMTPSWHLKLDGDGLVGGAGRAFDVSLKLGYQFADNWSAQIGYRTLEGGSDVDQVYNFVWQHYTVLSLAWSL